MRAHAAVSYVRDSVGCYLKVTVEILYGCSLDRQLKSLRDFTARKDGTRDKQEEYKA